MKKRKTVFTKNSDVKREHYLVDASGVVLGRLASKVAVYLRGKHKAIYTPQTDCGDYITVVNIDKVKVTGKKIKDKMYFTHSGWPGGDKMLSFEEMMRRKPAEVIQLAVKGMLPHTKLGDIMIKKLRVFCGEKAEYKKWTRLEV